MAATAALAQDAKLSVPMDRNAVTLILRLGLQDESPSLWEGRYELDRGRIEATDGWRFAGDDYATTSQFKFSVRRFYPRFWNRRGRDPSSLPEAQQVAAMRAYRVDVGGESLRLARGEFHRHTEISSDGGGDGSLFDMWRYGLDMVSLDWLGCGDHFMGEEFAVSRPPTLRVKLIGTAPFAEVVIVKANEYVYSIAPHEQTIEFEWTDRSATAGKTSYYYVRGLQEGRSEKRSVKSPAGKNVEMDLNNGEIVWVSPMWITYSPSR